MAHTKQATDDIVDVDVNDRATIERIVNDMNDTYHEQIAEAEHAYCEAQRQSVRTQHALKKLRKHKDRIEVFCTKHNITLAV